MMSLRDALRMNMMISYQELVRTFPEYGVRKAEERYRRNPSAENEDLLWRARSRITKRK